MATDRWDCNFSEFIGALQSASVIAQSPEARRKFTAKYRRELAFVSLYLHELSITGGKYEEHVDPPEQCDLCSMEISKGGFFVDGATLSGEGAWANMCPNCYADHGTGIGWGIGQLYRSRGKGRWSCIAGGDPNPETEE